MYCLTDTEVTEVTGRNVSADLVLAGLGFHVLLRYIIYTTSCLEYIYIYISTYTYVHINLYQFSRNGIDALKGVNVFEIHISIKLTLQWKITILKKEMHLHMVAFPLKNVSLRGCSIYVLETSHSFSLEPHYVSFSCWVVGATKRVPFAGRIRGMNRWSFWWEKSRSASRIHQSFLMAIFREGP